LLGGNPWVLWGYSQAAWSPITQVAELTSVYGISFVLAAANLALAEAWALRAAPRRAGAALLVGALLVAPPLAYGHWRLAQAEEPRAGTAVLIAQGNLDLGTQWQSEFYGQNLDVYLRLTLDALRATPAALVVWPESALTFFVADEPLYQDAIARVLGPFGATLLTGGPAVRRDDGHERFTNAAFTLTPDGSITAQYDKRRLLPFAEYLPFGEIDLLRRQFGKVREFVAGRPGLPLPTPAGAAGVLICNEALFPAEARARVAEGATLLVVLSNDTWMRDAQFSTIAFDMSALRAVEQRRWLIRASTSGPSAIVDAFGRVRVATDLDARTTIQGRVAPRLERTPYARWGDVFAWSCVALAALLTVRLLRR
jgi:apolipoprotein N-acyltransferase